MKKCTICGNECNDNDVFCPMCGQTKFENQNTQQAQQTEQNQNTQQNEQYYNPQYNPNMYTQPVIDPVDTQDESTINDALICGIVSLAIMLFGLSALSWIPALIGKNRLTHVKNPDKFKNYDTARILNKIGMILSIISIVIAVIGIILQIAFLVAGLGFGINIFDEIFNNIFDIAMIGM